MESDFERSKRLARFAVGLPEDWIKHVCAEAGKSMTEFGQVAGKLIAGLNRAEHEEKYGKAGR